MSPYLSIVAVSRNDDHGGDPLVRTQIFIDSLAAQCERLGLDAELILVEWNPPLDRPSLSAVLKPANGKHFSSRVVTVPPELHYGYKYSEKLPLFQMIGKNVGIRRAKGDFIVATNIDVLFSDELMAFIAQRKLEVKAHYRVDRYDIQSGLALGTPQSEVMDYAWGHGIRSNRRLHPPRLLSHLYGEDVAPRHVLPDPDYVGRFRDVAFHDNQGVWELHPAPDAHMEYLHTNACGDFALMSREGWDAIRGYPEFESYSFNIDSMGLIASHYEGYREISLLPPCVCFHIEHSLGSGWTPEGHNRLFGRLRAQNIISPDWPVLIPLVEKMRAAQASLEFNYPCWGLADYELQETPLGESAGTTAASSERLAAASASKRVGAIKPEFDYDRLAVTHGWLPDQEAGYAATTINAVDARLLIPDAAGRYDQDKYVLGSSGAIRGAPLMFRLDEYPAKQRLCLSPSAMPRLVEIRSVIAVDRQGRRVLDIAGSSLDAIEACSGASKQADSSYATAGSGPQLLLPGIDADIEFPLFILIDMTVSAAPRLDAQSV